jgi:hypothetical protein
MEIRLKTNENTLREMRTYLSDKQIKNAVRLSVNATLKTGKISIKDQIRKKYSNKIAAKGINSAAKIRNAKAKDLTGWIAITGKRLPLISFAPNIKKPIDWTGKANADRTPKGVTVTMYGKKSFRKGTFVAQMGNKHRGIYHQADESRGYKKRSIVENTGPSIPDLVDQGRIEKVVMAKMAREYEKKLNQKIEYIYQKAAR